jgi:type IV secretion system protein TrbL
MLALHPSARPADPDRAAAASSRARLRPWLGLSALAALGALALLPARVAEAQVPVVDVVTDLLKSAATAGAADLQPIALGMAFALATIELAVFALSFRDERLTLAFPLRGIAIRLLWWSWTMLILTAYSSSSRQNSFAHLIIEGGEELATHVSGIDGFAPHAVLAQGWSVTLEFADVLLRLGLRGFGLFTSNLGAFSILALDLLIVLASYYMVALALYFLVFQALLTLAIGPLFVAFGASRWTARLHDSYLTFALFIAIKIILFALVLRVGDDVTETLLALVAALGALEPAAVLDSPIPLTLTLASLAYALGAVLIGPVASRLTAGTLEIATAVLPLRSS